MLKLDIKRYSQKVLEFLSEDMRVKFENNLKKSEIIIEKVIRENISHFSEIKKMEINGELEYYFSKPDFDIKKIIFKDDTFENAKKYLQEISERISEISETDWVVENLKNKIWNWSGEIGRGNILHPMRIMLSGKDRSPDPFIIAEILGKEETLKRLSL